MKASSSRSKKVPCQAGDVHTIITYVRAYSYIYTHVINVYPSGVALVVVLDRSRTHGTTALVRARRIGRCTARRRSTRSASKRKGGVRRADKSDPYVYTTTIIVWCGARQP